jgi:hypothetical protein
MAQMSFSFRGAFCPTRFPLFQGACRTGAAMSCPMTDSHSVNVEPSVNQAWPGSVRPGAASGDRPHTGSRKSRGRPSNLQCHSTLSLPTGLQKSPT